MNFLWVELVRIVRIIINHIRFEPLNSLIKFFVFWVLDDV